MNALSSITWCVLTLIPLGLSAVLMLTRERRWASATFWRRSFAALALASIALIPFAAPYVRAAKLYGFVRTAQDALIYSATPIHWLVGSYLSKAWYGLNVAAREGEKELFPGLLPLLFTLAAIFLVKPLTRVGRAKLRQLGTFLVILDAVAVTCAILIIIISGFGLFKLGAGDRYLFALNSITPVFLILVSSVAGRVSIARPEILRQLWQRVTRGSAGLDHRPEGFWLGVIWVVIGFCGSLGMNFPFHRFLFDYIPLFRSIRVPARWAMICYLGLALLTGLGAKQLSDLVTRNWPKIRPLAVYLIIALCLLIEQRVAPLDLIRGAVDPDAVTIRLKQTPMRGGIVELPALYGGVSNYLYVLRAADHGRPLVTAMSGFSPPLEQQIESYAQLRPIPDEFVDLLESIPCSYLVIYNGFLGPADRFVLESFLGRGIAAGRLKFIKSYEGADLYAVTKTEPSAVSEAQPPFQTQSVAVSPVPDNDGHLATDTTPNAIDEGHFFVRMQFLDLLGREPDPDGLKYWADPILRCGTDSRCVEDKRITVTAALLAGKEFQETGFFLFRLYRATFGRAPTYAEFKSDRAKLIGATNLEASKNAFIESWVKEPRFLRLYSSQLTSEQFVDALVRTVRETSPTDVSDKRQSLLDELKGSGNRAKLLRRIVDDETLGFAEYNRAFVSMQYFGFLNRDPDERGHAFWIEALNKAARDVDREMIRVFMTSKEYRSRFRR
jgi:hypothetical protein